MDDCIFEERDWTRVKPVGMFELIKNTFKGFQFFIRQIEEESTGKVEKKRNKDNRTALQHKGREGEERGEP
jgi:hypothetical protein